MSVWRGGWQRRNTRKYLIERDGNQCRDCRESGDRVQLTIDHIVPRSRGGTNSVTNLRLLCETCHHDVTHHWHPGVGSISPRGERFMAAQMLATGCAMSTMPPRVREYAFDMVRLKHNCRV